MTKPRCQQGQSLVPLKDCKSPHRNDHPPDTDPISNKREVVKQGYTNVKDFNLDRNRALSNKADACKRSQEVTVENTDGGVRVWMQTGLYEIFKSAIQEHIEQLCLSLRVVTEHDTDKKGNIYITKHRPFNKLSGEFLLTMNLYHTTSSILANGPKDNSIFLEQLLPDVIAQIRKKRIDTTGLNQTISMQLSQLQKQLSLLCEQSSHSSEDCEQSSTEISSVNSPLVRTSDSIM